MFEFSLLSAAKEQRPASSCQSAIFGKIGKSSLNLAGMILHNSVCGLPMCMPSQTCSLYVVTFPNNSYARGAYKKLLLHDKNGMHVIKSVAVGHPCATRGQNRDGNLV